MRIALIHALRLSVAPTAEAFARLWPAATLMNLLDDSLSADLARDGALTAAMTGRFLTLARYAAGTGADGILFTCSAFGPCIEACAKALAPLPVLKPNEAMIEAAVAHAGPNGRIGLVASFGPTLASMPPEFPAGPTIVPCLAAEALEALDRGDTQAHDQAVARAAVAIKDCDVIALAQFSLARAADAVAAATGKPVLTTPDSAVRKLQRLLLTPTASFRASVRQSGPDAALSLPLQALWWDAKGDWAKAHDCAQADPGTLGSAVHAYLHRKEPDPANARYWYGRAGRPPATGSLDEEWQALVTALLAR